MPRARRGRNRCVPGGSSLVGVDGLLGDCHRYAFRQASASRCWRMSAWQNRYFLARSGLKVIEDLLSSRLWQSNEYARNAGLNSRPMRRRGCARGVSSAWGYSSRPRPGKARQAPSPPSRVRRPQVSNRKAPFARSATSATTNCWRKSRGAEWASSSRYGRRTWTGWSPLS